MNKKIVRAFLVVAVLTGMSGVGYSQRAKTNTRVFWVDHETRKLAWGDVVTANQWSLKTGVVENFPAGEKQDYGFGPLFSQDGLVIAGASWLKDDRKKHGWFAINSGVTQVPHGNHFHWTYFGRPTVNQAIEEDRQGAAVRAVTQNGRLYLIGEDGYLATNINDLKTTGTRTSGNQFFPADGRPLTQLEIVDNVVGYTAWGESDGEHAGQVDAINIGNGGKCAYSFKLPSGSASATTFCGGKVFFAHKDAISWITPDRNCSLSKDQVKVNPVQPVDQSLKLESSPEVLVNERDWVMFTTGTGESARLCLIEAASNSPAMFALPIKTAAGLKLSPPSTVLSMGKRYAFVFQQRMQAADDVEEQLTIVELDPNRDMRFDDARVVKTFPVGSTQVGDKMESHQVCFDEYGRFAVFTSPGAGTLSVISMHDLMLRVNFKVGGNPTDIVAVGAPEHFH